MEKKSHHPSFDIEKPANALLFPPAAVFLVPCPLKLNCIPYSVPFIIQPLNNLCLMHCEVIMSLQQPCKQVCDNVVVLQMELCDGQSCSVLTRAALNKVNKEILHTRFPNPLQTKVCSTNTRHKTVSFFFFKT